MAWDSSPAPSIWTSHLATLGLSFLSGKGNIVLKGHKAWLEEQEVVWASKE